MFNRKLFSDMRRVGMGVGVSKTKLTAAMLDILLQLPVGSTNLKDSIILNLGLMGQMASTRELDQAWNDTKKKAAKMYPEKFVFDGRNTLTWNDGTARVLAKDISSTNLKKLNELASAEGITVNAIVTKLLKKYQNVGG